MTTTLTAELGFSYTQWRADQDRQRAVRRLELETAFRRGLVVRQLSTFWSTAGCIYTRFGIRADATFIESAQSNPAYLAEHLENREYGFGFETVILHTCPDNCGATGCVWCDPAMSEETDNT